MNSSFYLKENLFLLLSCNNSLNIEIFVLMKGFFKVPNDFDFISIRDLPCFTLFATF